MLFDYKAMQQNRLIANTCTLHVITNALENWSIVRWDLCSLVTTRGQESALGLVCCFGPEWGSGWHVRFGLSSLEQHLCRGYCTKSCTEHHFWTYRHPKKDSSNCPQRTQEFSQEMCPRQIWTIEFANTISLRIDPADKPVKFSDASVLLIVAQSMGFAALAAAQNVHKVTHQVCWHSSRILKSTWPMPDMPFKWSIDSSVACDLLSLSEAKRNALHFWEQFSRAAVSVGTRLFRDIV